MMEEYLLSKIDLISAHGISAKTAIAYAGMSENTTVTVFCEHKIRNPEIVDRQISNPEFNF